LRAASGQKWFPWGDLQKNSWILDFIRLNFRYDPAPLLEKSHCPVLAIFGAEDTTVPVAISVSRVGEALGKSRAESLIVVFPGAGHDLRIEADNDQPWFFPKLAPGYLELLTSWVQDKTERVRDTAVAK
jgi:pimeloyl-ACP methyl ester carboxylesterase